MKPAALMLATLVATLGLAACGEKVQTAGSRKADAKAWSGAQDPFVAPGWKAGDQASWEEQMRVRAQGQNEYSRAAGSAQ